MKFTSSNETKVAGKMNEQDAGEVGKRLAYAAYYTGILFGWAAIIAAFRW